MLGHDGRDLRRAEDVLLEVRDVQALLAVAVGEVLQDLLLRVELLVDLGDDGLPVDRIGKRLPEPRRPQERHAALELLVEVQVLEGRSGVRLDLQAGLALEVNELELRLRVDRVDLAAANRLDLRVRVRPEDEDDLAQIRLVRTPPLRVRSERHRLALRVVRHGEGAVADRLARLRVVRVVQPDVVEIGLPVESVRRIERVHEEGLPGSERLAEDDVEALAVLARGRDRLDRVVAAAACDVVLRVDLLLPDVLEVLVGDRDAVAPDRLLLDLHGDRHGLRLDDLGALGEVGHEREVGLLNVQPAVLRPDRPGRPGVVAPAQETVQARGLLLGAEHDLPALLGAG